MKEIKEQLISFEIAKLAKEKGFKEDSRYCFDVNGDSYNVGHNNKIESDQPVYSRPTQSLLQRWLREIHNIHVEVRNDVTIGSADTMHYSISIVDGRHKNKLYPLWDSCGIASYEQALQGVLYKALKLI